MNTATRLGAIAGAAALALGCSSSARPAETPRQTTTEQVDQSAGYTEEVDPGRSRFDRDDEVWDDMGDFDENDDFRDEGAGPSGDDGSRGD